MSTKQEVILAEMVKVSPPATVTGLHFLGVSLSDLVMLLTALYTISMLYFLYRDKWWRDKGDNDGPET